MHLEVWSLESRVWTFWLLSVLLLFLLHYLSFENTHFLSFAASLEFLWTNLAVPWIDCASSNDATCWGILVCCTRPVIWQFAIVHRFCFSGQIQCQVRRPLDKGQYWGWLAGWLSESKSSSNSWWSASCFLCVESLPPWVRAFPKWSTKSISTNMLHSMFWMKITKNLSHKVHKNWLSQSLVLWANHCLPYIWHDSVKNDKTFSIVFITISHHLEIKLVRSKGKHNVNPQTNVGEV